MELKRNMQSKKWYQKFLNPFLYTKTKPLSLQICYFGVNTQKGLKNIIPL